MSPIFYNRLTSREEINDLRNRMAEGNYPLGISDCEVSGINGDCGLDCPAYGDSEDCPKDG